MKTPINQLLWAVVNILASLFITSYPQISLSDDQIVDAKATLNTLGYWLRSDDNSLDESLYYSLISFQRTLRIKPTGKLTPYAFHLIRTASPLKPKYKGRFHVEVDLSRRILFLVSGDGKVDHILPVAIGNDKMFFRHNRKEIARTPRGNFTIKRKILGWRSSDLGDMYYPIYFRGGLAIHGTKYFRTSGFTFGCIAIPKFAAQSLSDLLPLGTRVLVYK